MKKWVVILTVSLLLSICVVTIASAASIILPLSHTTGEPLENSLALLLKYKIVSYDDQGNLTCPSVMNFPNGDSENLQIKFYDLPDYMYKLQIDVASGYFIITAYSEKAILSESIFKDFIPLANDGSGFSIFAASMYGSMTSIEHLQQMLGVSGTVPGSADEETAPTVNGLKYQLSGKTAAVTGPEDKNEKKLKIPASIKVDGKTYKVTAIKAKAFKGMKKLTTVEIGKNVKDIGKEAFRNCSKLKSITIKTTKLTEKTVKSNAFKGIYKKATFKCPQKKLEAYQKLLIKRGAPKTCKFK